MPRTKEEWLGFVLGHTITKSREDAEKIAEMCATTPSTCVWHEHAKFYGNLDKCNCARCKPQMPRRDCPLDRG